MSDDSFDDASGSVRSREFDANDLDDMLIDALPHQDDIDDSPMNPATWQVNPESCKYEIPLEKDRQVSEEVVSLYVTVFRLVHFRTYNDDIWKVLETERRFHDALLQLRPFEINLLPPGWQKKTSFEYREENEWTDASTKKMSKKAKAKAAKAKKEEEKLKAKEGVKPGFVVDGRGIPKMKAPLTSSSLPQHLYQHQLQLQYLHKPQRPTTASTPDMQQRPRPTRTLSLSTIATTSDNRSTPDMQQRQPRPSRSLSTIAPRRQ